LPWTPEPRFAWPAELLEALVVRELADDAQYLLPILPGAAVVDAYVP